ncbi:olfactory receptor 14I1-like [Passerculus sandwichensis]
MSNSSSISHFLLLALADTRQLQLLHFCLLLGISLAALLGNGLIISAVACGHNLHTPMFFFLLNLALSDLGSICTTVPKAMHNSFWDTRASSYTGCAAQLFFFMFFISAEFCLLTIMCYDRYVSICKPLHYGTLLGSRACAHMAAAAWASGFLYALLHIANTFSLPLCRGNALGQFFCEIPHILKLSCSISYVREVGLIAVSVCLALGCFVFIVFSYVQIFRVVLRIPSEQGRHKAFSTCLPHLAVFSLFLRTGTFAHLKPSSISSPTMDLSVSVLYSVVTPTLNPLIYSLRNQELKAAVWRLFAGAGLSSDCGDRQWQPICRKISQPLGPAFSFRQLQEVDFSPVILLLLLPQQGSGPEAEDAVTFTAVLWQVCAAVVFCRGILSEFSELWFTAVFPAGELGRGLGDWKELSFLLLSSISELL